MRIDLNLATRPYFNLAPALRRLRIAIAALVVAALALGAGLYAIDEQAHQARLRSEAVDAQIARVQAERNAAQARMKLPENAAVLTEAQNLNQLFDAKAFSWTLAMEDLERMLPPGVQVTTLEPMRDSKDGHISVHVRVLGPRDKSIDLVRNLEHSRRFTQPRIVGESAETASGPNQRIEPVTASSRVNFDLLAEYNPPTDAERSAAPPAREAAAPAPKPATAPPALHPQPHTGTVKLTPETPARPRVRPGKGAAR